MSLRRRTVQSSCNAVLLILLGTSPAQADLVSHWDLDAVSGPTATDSIGTNHGILGPQQLDVGLGPFDYTTPTWGTGKIGGGLVFAGGPYQPPDGNAGDAVQVPDDLSLNTTNLTVSCWINSTLADPHVGYVTKGWGSNLGDPGGWIMDSTNGFRVSMQDDSALTYTTSATPATPVPDGTWHCGVLTYDGAKSSLAAYVDGVLVQKRSAQLGPTVKDIMFGGDAHTTFSLQGTLDDIGFWDTVLKQPEIKGLASLGNHVDLNYNLVQAEELFKVHRVLITGSTLVGGRTWQVTGGLTGNVGEVEQSGSDYSLRLDNAGNGVTTGTPSPVNPPVAPRATLVSHWKLDDGDGAVATDSVGNNPGELGPQNVTVRTTVEPNQFNFTAPDWTAGRLGGALTFDGGPYNPGDGSAGDAVMVPHDETDLNDTDLSVAVWARTTQDADYVGLVTKGWGANLEDPGGWQIDTRATFGVSSQVQDGGGLFTITEQTPIADGQWHSIVLTYSTETQELRSYVDGNAPNVREEADMDLSIKDIMFGGDAHSTVHYVGDLDDIGYWTGVLTDGEARAVYTLAEEVGLAYDLGEASQLFEVAQAGSGEVTLGSLTWSYATELSGGIGTVVKIGEDYFLQLDADGGGVATGESLIPGDLDGDGFVGGADLDIVRSFWGQFVTAGNKEHGDPSGDGFVGGDDLDEVRANWGEGTPPSAPVPEPASVTLLWVGAVGLLALAWHRRISGNAR